MGTVDVDLVVIRRAAAEYLEVLKELQDIKLSTEVLSQVRAPGNDLSSQLYADAANERGSNCQQANDFLSESINTHMSKLQKTIDQYSTTEGGNAASFTSNG